MVKYGNGLRIPSVIPIHLIGEVGNRRLRELTIREYGTANRRKP